MKKILIIDDVDYIRKSIARVLEGLSYECDVCENGKLALEKIKEQEFDLIITDIMMPEMDGFELLELLQQQPEPIKSTPVLAISGGSKTINSDVALSMVTNHAAAILQKPFSKSDLIDAINDVFAKRQSA